MKFKLLILLPLFYIAFLATISQGIYWENPSYNASEMIGSGETTVITSQAGQAATPKESEFRNGTKNTQDWTMPSSLSGSSNSAKSSRAEAEATSEQQSSTSASSEETSSAESTADNASTATASTADTELPPAQTAAAAANVGGSWSFLLNDTQEKDLALSLFQKDGDVFGAGKMREGEGIVDVAVSGTVTSSTLQINLVTLGTISLYKLDLDLSGEAASGRFQAISTSGETWTGNADGQKTA